MENNLVNSPMGRMASRLIAPVMSSRFRHRFFDPVKALRAAGIRAGMKVLEVGPGTGFYTIPAASLVGREGSIHSIDVSSLALEHVGRKLKDAGLENIKLIKGDALATGLPAEAYDLILLFGVIPSPTLPLDRLLPEMHRVLRPGGILAVWTAFTWGLERGLSRGGWFGFLGKENGVYCFKKRDEGR